MHAQPGSRDLSIGAIAATIFGGICVTIAALISNSAPSASTVPELIVGLRLTREPATVSASETLTMQLRATTTRPAAWLGLGATLVGFDGGSQSDPAGDRTMSLPRGTSDVQRSFTIPGDTSPGECTLIDAVGVAMRGDDRG